MNVEVNKDELIKRLEYNRALHEQELDEARSAFLAKARRELTNALRQVDEGVAKNVTIHVSAPESHLEDFDRAISMVSRHQGETIALHEGDFSKYWDNEWEWRDRFVATTQSYRR